VPKEEEDEDFWFQRVATSI